MKVAASNRLHAPENSRIALLSAFTSGADLLRFTVRLTADGQAVLAAEDDVRAATGVPGRVSAMTLAEVRKLDFSATFMPRGSPGFRYRAAGRAPVRIEPLGDLLDVLPDEVDLPIDATPDATPVVRALLTERGMLERASLEPPGADVRLVDSMLDEPRQGFDWIQASFAGKNVDTRRFAFGYAKANRFAEITQNDGVHVKLAPYDGPISSPDDLLHFAMRDWPYYSGGGFGLLPGIRGDFAAELDFSATHVAQATMCELAVVNVNPGTHRSSPPETFRDKDSFFDPHGAPPFVGVEHDEDDGYRINSNLGTEYDNNRYGSPVGDGTVPAGRFRLERRGAYFSAYYRNAADATDWVCVGAIRNDSMNPLVHLRGVGKRWRQEDGSGGFFPIPANEFVFGNLTVTLFG